MSHKHSMSKTRFQIQWDLCKVGLKIETTQLLNVLMPKTVRDSAPTA